MATMTWVGMDVHARCTEAAVIDTLSGELTRTRFGAGVEVIAPSKTPRAGHLHAAELLVRLRKGCVYEGSGWTHAQRRWLPGQVLRA